MLPEPQRGAVVQMNTREVGAKLYCYIYFISLVWMRFCRTFLPLSCLGCLAKQGSKEKTLLPISDIVKLHVMHLPVSGSSTELLSKKLREHQSLAFTPLVPGWEPLRGVKKKKKSCKTMRSWRVCVSSPPKVWAAGLLFSSASLLGGIAERETNQLFLFCNNKCSSLLTSALCKYSQAQKGIEIFQSRLYNNLFRNVKNSSPSSISG